MNLTASYKAVLIELRELKETVADLKRKFEELEKRSIQKQYVDAAIPVTLKRGPGRPRKVS
jgi:hypothetical protein